MPRLLKILDEYWEEKIAPQSGVLDDDMEDACEAWVTNLIDEFLEEEGYTFKALGARGGIARAKNLSKEELSEIGKKGAMKRWKK